jgi:hypothetical protein
LSKSVAAFKRLSDEPIVETVEVTLVALAN